MSALPERTRGETCLSDLRLDQLIRQELDAGSEAAARAHLAGCAVCEARVAQLEGFRAQFVATLSALPRPPAPARAQRWRWAWISGASGLLAVAAAVLLFAHPFAPRRDEWRSKGQGHLRLFVARGNTVRPSASGDIVAPGDGLQFTYTLPERRFFALLGRDGRGTVSVFFPDGAQTVPLAPGRDVSLPRSTILDDVLGQERLYGVFCERETPLGPLRADLLAGRAPSAPGCEVEPFILEKRRP
jgi:hypothetical protein